MITFWLIILTIIEIIIWSLIELILLIGVLCIIEFVKRPYRGWRYRRRVKKWEKAYCSYLSLKEEKEHNDKLREEYPLFYWNKPKTQLPKEPRFPNYHDDYHDDYY